MIALSLLTIKLALLHPIHISVCDIVYNSDNKHLKISVRLFLNDLETGLKPRTELEYYNIMDKSKWETTQKVLEKYLNKNLKLSINNKELDLTYLGSEIDGYVMWCYLEVENLKSFDKITVQYTPLMELFDDQENLVYVRVDRVVRSCRIYGERIEHTLEWD